MAPRIPPLLQPQIGFAHRGARAHHQENTLESFQLALRLGATGIETDAWITRDGEVVLDHDGVVGMLLRRRPIREVGRSSLPGHVPTLGELYEVIGTDIPLSIDVKDGDAAGRIIEIAREQGDHAVGNLWLCSGNLEHLGSWRQLDPSVRLVDSTRRKNMKEGPERRALRLVELGIDAINMHHTEWSGGLTTLFHRFERYTFAWDVQHERQLIAALDMGIDGVYSDWSDRLAVALQRMA